METDVWIELWNHAWYGNSVIYFFSSSVFNYRVFVDHSPNAVICIKRFIEFQF